MEAQAQTEETISTEPTPAPAPVNGGKASGADGQARRSVREEKGRKKDDKSVDYVLRTLHTLSSPEEKLTAMCKKFTEVVDDNRKLLSSVKQAEKRLSVLQREKEQLQTEHSKAVLTRSRLESLCRELQRQNKAVKDESLLKIREEEEKRKEVSNKFQSTLTEITTLMQQNNEKNSKLRDDNLEMNKKFKSLCEQYEMREQQIEKMTRQMQLESQLADAKLAKAQLEIAAEKESLLREKQQLLLELQEYQTKCQDLQATEVSLRSQISLYTDKYDEFQNALTRSNEVFGGFKGEMDKMSRKVSKLQKEALMWKNRCEKSHQTLLEMAEDKQKQDAELAQASRKLAQLQKLCRTLQAERTALHAQLRASDLKGQHEDGSGSLTSELQSVCDRLTETLGSLQLSPENTLDQAECPSKVRSKAHRLSSEASTTASPTCVAVPSGPRLGSCGCAEDVQKQRAPDSSAGGDSSLPPGGVDASLGHVSTAEESAGVEEAPSENIELTTEPQAQESVSDSSGAERVEMPSLGSCCTAASPDVNFNVCSQMIAQLSCSSPAAVPCEEANMSNEMCLAVDAEPVSCCSESANHHAESDSLPHPQIPGGSDIFCEPALLEVQSAGKNEVSTGCTNISDEILFKPIANGHAILLPEESLPIVMETQNDIKKRKDAGKKRKK